MTQMLVFTNPAEGKEEEFNTWYDTVHLPELRQVPGVRSAQRYRAQGSGEHKYLAVYELDDPSVAQEIGRRTASGEATPSDALDVSSAKVLLWEPI